MPAAKSSRPVVLLVEDSPSLVEIYQEYLDDLRCKLICVETGAAALEQIREAKPHAVLLDLNLPDMDGMQILDQMQTQQLSTAVVVITAHGSVDLAVDAMRHGAVDFLEKPIDADRLRNAVQNALATEQAVSHIRNGENQSTTVRDHYHGFIGASAGMQDVYRIIDSAAPSNATIFVTGESGTGKEICADAIHAQSPRANKPFVPINCGAIPRDLMESEIFGHVKGAFTGALSERQGAATTAHGGTLFLDEIGEMDLDLQTKLLRFVQTGTFQKVGGNKQETVDVRFVCATNRDPLEMVQQGQFREDLYYRLHVIPIHLPPLRDRGDDIMAIARHLLRQSAQQERKDFDDFSPETEQVFRTYAWPGNVRQMLNIVRNVVILNSGGTITPSMLPPPLSGVVVAGMQDGTLKPTAAADSEMAGMPDRPEAIRPLWMVEKEAIETAIRLCDDNIPRAAALLEVSPSTIYRKVQSWKD